MPSTVFIRFDAPQPVEVTPRRLHAAWGHVFDLPEGISPSRAQRLPALAHRPVHDAPGSKPYSIGEISKQDDTIGVEIRLLDDRLLDTLDAWLAWGGVLSIGDGQTNTLLAAIEAHILHKNTWEDIAAQTSATTWVIHLLSPTVFTSHGQHRAETTPASLATSIHSRWKKWSSHTVPLLPERALLEKVLTIEDWTRIVTVNLGMPRNDKRGRLTQRRIHARTGELRVSGLVGAPTTAIFSQLMALTRYTNVGSHTSYGMGIIDVSADDS